jgi:hypothetical protein
MEFTPSTKTIRIHNEDKTPFRVQIPRMRVTNMTEFGYLELEANEDFVKLWEPLEQQAKDACTYSSPWRSVLFEGVLRIKIDERTHIFDSKSRLIWTDKFVNKLVTCIIELKSIYDFKGYSGISCRIHQIKIHQSECLI